MPPAESHRPRDQPDTPQPTGARPEACRRACPEVPRRNVHLSRRVRRRDTGSTRAGPLQLPATLPWSVRCVGGGTRNGPVGHFHLCHRRCAMCAWQPRRTAAQQLLRAQSRDHDELERVHVGGTEGHRCPQRCRHSSHSRDANVSPMFAASERVRRPSQRGQAFVELMKRVGPIVLGDRTGSSAEPW